MTATTDRDALHAEVAGQIADRRNAAASLRRLAASTSAPGLADKSRQRAAELDAEAGRLENQAR